jgi:MFS family permease
LGRSERIGRAREGTADLSGRRGEMSILRDAMLGAVIGLVLGPILGTALTEAWGGSPEHGFEGFLHGLTLGPAAGAPLGGWKGWARARRSGED